MPTKQIEEVELYFGIAAMDLYLKGKKPQSGDVLRISYIINETERKYTFYDVSNITPVDIFNFHYLNWHVHAQQTQMHDIPDVIKLYGAGQ